MGANLPPFPSDMPEPPLTAPRPAPGRASISGLLYSYTIARIVPETLFYLTPAVGTDQRSMPRLLIGPDEDRGDIIGTSDAQGLVVLDDVPPGNYYLIVWAPLNWTIVEESPANQMPHLIELRPGDEKPLGVLFVSWP